MASNWKGAAAGFIGGQVVGRVLSFFLASRAGERTLNLLDRRELTPLEHRVLAQRWAGDIGKALSAVATLLVLARSGNPGRGPADILGVVTEHQMAGPTRREIDWVQVLQRAAEVLLAVGAIVKVVGEYLEDRKQTSLETQRAAAKRLS